MILSAAAAAGSTFSAVVAYGDSLSDNGNLFSFIGQPGAPYYAGRASNGPVAVERLAAILGDPLQDFAWLGATTGVGNQLDPGGTPTTIGLFGAPGMTTAYQRSLAEVTPIASSALFVVWGGANDFLAPSPLDANPIAVADRAVSNLISIASGVQALGAGHVVVLGLPDLGLTPFGRAMGLAGAAQATALSNYFNLQLAAALPSGVIFFDTASLLRTVIANPSAYGFANVTSPCFDPGNPASLCSNPDQYLFFDDLHPTTRGHQIVAENLAILTSVPEPSTLGLSALALALLARRARLASRK